ncbi:PTS sugar transporter subunit IIA [Lactobacillus porci]|uniref:PTS sugar transporter subunit IIA n=1 Tax=Lactobacillus porci TaxID=2012477 RepID=A0A6A8MD97_9LACO|nr:PTS sugar transporter subunit IIA [Lactobacillus porci]MDD6416833.1 PTS sugar transporter subunit IIA [Lactobacillus porci]MDD6720374.1 PTS sugar transporter subunit IIA [Lactobacillus porci]MST86220.1 PTS sugar transporter subunit IIA [Lactobacillus porci]
MKYVFLVSHGKFAEGLKTSLEMFAGDAAERVFAIGLHNGKSADDFKKEVEALLDAHKFNDDDEFMILADLIGGSPLTTFMNVFNEYGLLDRATILGGMNFTMALTVVVSLDGMDRDLLAQTALGEAKQALQEYKVPSSDADDDEDDI